MDAPTRRIRSGLLDREGARLTGLLVALDFPAVDRSLNLATSIKDHVSGFKVGLEMLMGPDPHSIEKIVELGMPVFVDAKLHDIPATVAGASRQLARRGARWVTVHLSGGPEMVRACVDGLTEGSAGETAGALGVTVLTSLDDEDMARVGVSEGAGAQAVHLASFAEATGCEGLICSVREVTTMRQVAPSLITVTPGIRAAGSDTNDQKRVASVGDAVEIGADYIVVGRAITAATDPVRAAREISRQLADTAV